MIKNINTIKFTLDLYKQFDSMIWAVKAHIYDKESFLDSILLHYKSKYSKKISKLDILSCIDNYVSSVIVFR